MDIHYRELPLHEKCPNTEFFSILSLRIQSECGKIQTRKNSIFGHFSPQSYPSMANSRIKIDNLCTRKGFPRHNYVHDTCIACTADKGTIVNVNHL